MRLVIVDDHPILREGLVRTLGEESDLTVVGEGASVEDALRLVTQWQPDILLLDLDIPGNGLSALKDIGAAAPATRIVILTFAASEEHLVAALSGGVMSYVLKGVTGRELVKIIRDAHAGRGYVPPALAAHVLTSRSARPSSAPANLLRQLTEREQQILRLVGNGCTNGEIAGILSLAETTVKNTMTTIMQKLQVRNRVEAAILANRASQSMFEHSPTLDPL